MKAALLSDRGVVRVVGAEAAKFLNGLFTADIAGMPADGARFAALLTPQGKIVVDFIVVRAGDAFLLDCARAQAVSLAAKIGFYKLRAKVAVEDVSDTLAVVAAWSGQRDAGGGFFVDPRLPALGLRAIVAPDQVGSLAARIGAGLVDAQAYEAHRIALGVPRGGVDFAYGDTFPHEADMDQLAGVDFDKGCYVGQEVVSRMEHRGLARTRVVPFRCEGQPPEPGTPVMAGDRTLGSFGSSSGACGLALVRLDRLATALEAGAPVTAGGAVIRPLKPAWARFDVPGQASAAE